MSSNQSPTLVSDAFHYSSFYWRESSSNLAGLGGAGSETDDENSNAGGDNPASSGDDDTGRFRMRSDTVGSEEDPSSEVLKPHPIANHDRVKLKFYSHVLGDGTENIHYG